MSEFFEADPPIPPNPLLGGGGMVTNSYGDDVGDGPVDEVDDIDVYPPWEFPSTPPYSPGGTGGGDGGGGGQGGGGGGGTQTPPVDPARPYDGCDDRKADDLSEELRQELLNKADRNTREYGALIWRDDAGNLHRTELFPGTNSQAGMPSTPQEGGFSSWSQVVGVFHSHPTTVFGANGNPINVTPESNFHLPSSGDWSTMHSWATNNGVSVANLTAYIAYQDQVREFDWSDNVNEDRNPQAQIPGHGVESGDYNPGSSC